LIVPVGTFLGVSGLCGYLVWYAFAIEAGRRVLDTRGLSERDAILARILYAIAGELGVVGSIAVSAVLAVAGGVWLFFTLRSVRQSHPSLPPIELPVRAPLPELAGILAEHVRAYRRELRIGALLLIALAAAGGPALIALEADAGSVAMVPLCGLVGGALVVLGSRDPKRDSTLARLTRRPQEVAWVYVEHAVPPGPAWVAKLLRSEPLFFDNIACWSWPGRREMRQRGRRVCRERGDQGPSLQGTRRR
jgi:hypothetical protein